MKNDFGWRTGCILNLLWVSVGLFFWLSSKSLLGYLLISKVKHTPKAVTTTTTFRGLRHRLPWPKGIGITSTSSQGHLNVMADYVRHSSLDVDRVNTDRFNIRYRSTAVQRPPSDQLHIFSVFRINGGLGRENYISIFNIEQSIMGSKKFIKEVPNMQKHEEHAGYLSLCWKFLYLLVLQYSLFSKKLPSYSV